MPFEGKNTEQKKEKVKKAILIGKTLTDAAREVRCAHSTIFFWRKKDKDFDKFITENLKRSTNTDSNFKREAVKKSHITTRKRIADQKKELIKHREDGLSQVDCCYMVGVTSRTVGVWKRVDPDFKLAFKKAYSVFRQDLIKRSKEKDSFKMLTKIDKRFRDEPKKELTQYNQQVLVDDKTAANLFSKLFGGSNREGNIKEIEGVEY